MPQKNKKESPQSLLFEEGIERLEAIIERMESERIPLDELMKDYEEGTKLLSLCRNHIDGARQKVEKINKEIEAMASNTVSTYGSGGMITKISAAKTAMSSGCHMVISSGKIKNPIKAIINGSKCTWFIPSRNPLTARKQWIVGSMQPPGNIIVDKGAASAIQNKKSLLPAGITKVEGNFERGDSVIIKKIDGTLHD